MYSQIDTNKRKTALLIALFIAFVIGLGYGLDWYFQGGGGILALAIIISMIMSLISYYQADKIALAATGAREIKKTYNPYVYNMVENLCITAGMPVPRVHIINSPALNAFATGRDPKHAAIALTTGIIAALENEELEGVIAHELSHVKNYDIRVMTVVVVLAGTVALLGNFFFRAHFFGGRHRDNRQAGGILMLVGLIFLILSPIIAELIKLAISRKREYLADASGALLTRYPEGLALALEKISQSPATLATASAATAHLFISNPIKKESFLALFSTHPPIKDRVLKLRKM